MENIGRREFIKTTALTALSFSPLFGATHKCYVELLPKPFEYHIKKGKTPGKRVLLIGGIHGNEIGAYKAADMLVETEVKKGELIIVPRSNFTSILANVRGYNGDMNRKFGPDYKKDADSFFIENLKNLILEMRPDVVISMHDGFGFYKRNKNHWGQSIVIDESEYGGYNLLQKANYIVESANRTLPKKLQLGLKNTYTFTKEIHKEQRNALTGWCLRHGIEAYCFESSRNLPLKQQLQTHLVMLEYLLKLYEIEISPTLGQLSARPLAFLPKVDFSFILSINGQRYRFRKSSSITIPKGSNIKLLQIDGGRGGYLVAQGVDLNWRTFKFSKGMRFYLHYDAKKRFSLDVRLS